MKFLVWLGLLVMAAPTPAGQGKGYGKGHDREAGTSVSVQVFAARDRRIIQDYCRALPPGNLPPGLAKRGGALPPGLEKQLRRNGRLPPGLERRLDPFPVELERRLVSLPAGYGRAFIAGRAVIYNKSTSLILDVFGPL